MLSQLPQRSAQPATTARGSHAAPSSVAWRGAASAGGMRLAPSQRPLSRRGCRLGPVHTAAAAGGAPPDASAPTPAPTPDMTLEPFKSLVAGRRFSCTMCGKCCTGDGEIWLAPEEIPRIAKHLNLSTQRFLDTYTKQYSKYRGWRMLKTAGDSGQSCVFLSPLDGKTCLVHSVRPSQCSTYPWWPELMHDAEWDWEKANICEGFDHADAPELDVEEAARQLKEANTMTQLRLLASNVRITPKEMDWATRVLVWEEEDGEEGPGGGGAAAKETNAGKQGKGPKPEKGGKRK